MAAVGALALARWPRLVAAGRPLHVGPPSWAGHNRWSKVRNVKGPRDAARSRLFQRLGLMLRTAAREGGPDPALNAQLANVVEQCRAKNMPKASIEAAIRGAERSVAASRLLYEARGPGGSALLLEVLTDNPRRSQQDVRLILTRHGGTMAEGARHGFEQKGVVRVGSRDLQGHPVSLEAALEAALEAGAQDVCPDEEEEEEEEEEPALKFICETSALRTVQERLEASGLRPLSAAIEYLPRDRVTLPEGTREQAERLLQALGDCPDIVRLYHNIQ
ncbi:translational activator of cytochrome c oxidase 1 [Gymnogyps californianus]|uniref:translational activator of cytochrome c oxidase 1 n=1 Tax=Gymnogyps californianus TaxID=33616 RepID=UPI0021CA710D|nr:translational activator of cytochrome c oxidase 1 [Gymnogyps californianus]